ncbi:hypothetical protein SNEBB_003033 [Seison nebaliae]|nr:hypothetical protein SNEBB_003033 [Seison nebaliae]
MWPVTWMPRPYDSFFQEDDWNFFGDFGCPLTFSNEARNPNRNVYRIVVKLDGHRYQRGSVRVTQRGPNKLQVEAEERDGDSNNFHHHSFSKVVDLPKDIDVSKFKYKVQSNNTVLIFAPYIVEEKPIVKTIDNQLKSFDSFFNNSDSGFLNPKLEEDKLKCSIDLGKYKPEDMNIEVNGNQLTVKGKKKEESDNGDSFVASSFQKSTTLPNGTHLDTLKCDFDEANHQLTITANYNKQSIEGTPKDIPIQKIEH